jgi:phospholipase/carboxylesterase
MTSSRFSRSFDPRESNRANEEPADSINQPAPDTGSVAEVILLSETGTVRGVCERTRTSVRPCGVFVPENYERHYAYPLIIWLHEAGRSERDIVNVLPHISMRNYLGLALRGTTQAHQRADDDGNASAQYRWSRSERSRISFQDELYASVRRLRRDYHIHTERIFLAGSGDGATMAWELFLARPEWFAGLAAFGGRFPWRRRPLRRYRELRQKRVFMAADARDPEGLSRAEEVAPLLYSAGIDVTVRCSMPGERWPQAFFRPIDRWIMHAIGGCL